MDRLPPIKKPSPHFFFGPHYLNLTRVSCAFSNSYYFFTISEGHKEDWPLEHGKTILTALRAYHEAHESST